MSRRSIKNNIIYLSNNLENDEVEYFIEYIKDTSIPNRPEIWNLIRACYKLVNQEPDIDRKLKNDLRRVLLGKGVNV